GAKAVVDPVPEREVWLRLAGRVAVGGADADGDVAARGNDLAAHLDVAGRLADGRLHGAVATEALLDGVGEQRAVGADGCVAGRVRREGLGQVAEQAGGGDVARRQQHRAGAGDV